MKEKEWVKMNPYGFYELIDKPNIAELQQYYANKYYQEERSSYSKWYSSEEISYINNKIIQKHKIISKFLPNKQGTPYSMLDIGCGEGWAISYYHQMEWDVLGLDYSSKGCESHNPKYMDRLIVGDVYESIQELIHQKKTFDLIWLDNVLEHVLEPGDLLNQCRKLVNNKGVLVIEVPNDFSIVQDMLLQQKLIPSMFWKAIPDHISYFNQSGLRNICAEYGWKCELILGDFPIDWNLFDINTNYIVDKSKGPSCHQARVVIENLLHHISVDKTNELYKILGEMGLGRQIIGFFRGVAP